VNDPALPLHIAAEPEAREKAASARKLRAEHKDPIEARDAVRASLPTPVTFQAVAAEFLAVNGPAFSPKLPPVQSANH
jgi:hypothetical protein